MKDTEANKTKSQQKELKDFSELKPFFESLERSLKQYEAKREELKKNAKNRKYEQKKLVFPKETKKGSGLMKNQNLKVEYLKNGKKQTVLVKSSREQIELWNRQRKGEIIIISAHKQEKK